MRPKHTLLAALLAVIISWRFQHDFHDVLEAQATLGGPWMEVPGPYKLAPNRDGSFNYLVEIPENAAPRLFFRVRRDWGWPDVGPVLPDYNDNTQAP